MSGYKELGTKLRNWRRWGPDDELGTVNFITAASRLRGVQAARSGRVIQLGMPFDANGPQVGGLRFNPVHRMSMLLSDGEFGVLVGFQKGEVTRTPLAEIAGRTKPITAELVELARILAK